MQKGKNHVLVKKENKALIKTILYQYAPISRLDIAEKLQLTPPAITNIIHEMIQEGIVHEVKDQEETQRKVGRQPIGVDFVSDARFVLGISIGRKHTRIVLTNLRGHIIYQVTKPVMPKEYKEMLSQLCLYMNDIKKQYSSYWNKLIGIGIAFTYLVDSHKGIICSTNKERPTWENQSIGTYLEEKYDMPVRIENNVRGRTNYISLFQPQVIEGYETYVLCHVSHGIAAPMILKNESVRGEFGAAGEIGHMIINPEAKDRKGTLEDYASVRAILQETNQLLKKGKAPILKKICGRHQVTIQDVLQAQREKDKDVRKVMQHAMTHIGIAIGNIIDFVNPKLILLSGPLFENQENIKWIQEAVKEYSYVWGQKNIQIIPVDCGEYGGALGAAASCLEKNFIREE